MMKLKDWYVKISFLVIRSLSLDWKLWTRVKLGVFKKLELTLKKYWLPLKHLVFKFRFGESNVRLFGRRHWYNNAVCGIVGLEVILSEHLYWFSQLDLPRDPVIVDVGANVGYVPMAVKSLYPAARVYCFEPVAETFEVLKKNTAHIAEGIEYFNYAVGDYFEEVGYVYNPESPAQSHVSGEGRSAMMVTLDMMFSDSGIMREERIDILKIDTEGCELEVLRGAVDILQKVRYVHMEFDSRENLLSDLLDVIRDAGRRYQLRFIRNFKNTPDVWFTDGDLLLELM